MPKSADELTTLLVDRLTGATDIVVTPVSVAHPALADAIEIRLLAMRPKPEPRGWQPLDMLSLDYLVAVRLADPLAEHRVTADLMFALNEDPDFTLVDETASAACQALALPVSAGLIVRGTIARGRPAEDVPLVRHPLTAKLGDLAVVRGRILGPGAIPIANAKVQLIGLDTVARTGPDGQFRLVAPPLPTNTKLRVRAQARGFAAEEDVIPGEATIVTLSMET